jgi:S-formylglutathione hydrolase FrmB
MITPMVDDEGRVSRRTVLLGGLGALVAAGTAGVALEWDNPRVVRLLGRCGDTPALPEGGYRTVTGTFDSTAMGATVPWLVALPPDHDPDHEKLPLVLCLHGAGADADKVGSAVGFPAYAGQAGRRVALAAPGGGESLYWHPRADGRDPLRWALEEFLPMAERRFGVGGTRANRGAIGWSMGGFGALLVAQQRPDLFSAAAALSPAVWTSYGAARSGHAGTFDSADDWARYGLWNHVDELRGTPTYVTCGGADPFAPTARELLERIPGVTGDIEDGCHDNGFWRRQAPAALAFLDHQLVG